MPKGKHKKIQLPKVEVDPKLFNKNTTSYLSKTIAVWMAIQIKECRKNSTIA